MYYNFITVLICLFFITSIQAEKFYISGQVSNAIHEYIDFQRFNAPFEKPDVTRYTLKKDGSFEGYLELDSESYYRMYFGRKYVTLYFLKATADFKINFNGLKMLETLCYKGKQLHFPNTS